MSTVPAIPVYLVGIKCCSTAQQQWRPRGDSDWLHSRCCASAKMITTATNQSNWWNATPSYWLVCKHTTGLPYDKQFIHGAWRNTALFLFGVSWCAPTCVFCVLGLAIRAGLHEGLGLIALGAVAPAGNLIRVRVAQPLPAS
jgi:hypothetical protein